MSSGGSSPVRCVIFDCGGVLAADLDWDAILSQLPEEHHQLGRDTISKQWNAAKVQPGFPEDDLWNALITEAHLDPEAVPPLKTLLPNRMKPVYPVVGLVRALIRNICLTLE